MRYNIPKYAVPAPAAIRIRPIKNWFQVRIGGKGIGSKAKERTDLLDNRLVISSGSTCDSHLQAAKEQQYRSENLQEC